MFQGRYQAHFNAVVNMDCFKLEKLLFPAISKKMREKVSKRESCARNKKRETWLITLKRILKMPHSPTVFKRIRLYLRMFDCINKICTDKINPSPTEADRITLF
jgi:hypothetical protein